MKALQPGKRILIEWDGYSGRTTVEWTFAAREDSTTFVAVTETVWTGNGDELAEYTVESAQGFTLTLAALKAFPEHGLGLGLVADKNPDAPVGGIPIVQVKENAMLQNARCTPISIATTRCRGSGAAMAWSSKTAPPRPHGSRMAARRTTLATSPHASSSRPPMRARRRPRLARMPGSPSDTEGNTLALVQGV